MRARTLWRLRLVGGVTIMSGIVGGIYGAGIASSTSNVTAGLLVGAMNGLAISVLEVLLQGPGAATLRRLSLPLVLALRTLVYCAVFLATGSAATSLVRVIAPRSLESGMVMTPRLPFSLSVALLFNAFFVLSSLLGRRFLIALAIGRYRRPRSEQRVVLFLDLHGSTGHAERLGDEKFHRFLNQVFFDISDPVLTAGGEIYRYVGDEIIITWPLARGVRDAACIACFFAIEDALVEKRGDYLHTFDAEPRLRGAIHAGTLVVGEMGDLKREIVMLGDTMNTAARIEEICRNTGRNFLASAVLLGSVSHLPPGVKAEALGEVALRGREVGVQLFALGREGETASIRRAISG